MAGMAEEHQHAWDALIADARGRMTAHVQRHGHAGGIVKGLEEKLGQCGVREAAESVRCFADLVPNWQAALDLWSGSLETLRHAKAEMTVKFYSTMIQEFAGAAHQVAAGAGRAGWDHPTFETLLAAAEGGRRSIGSFCKVVMSGPLQNVILQARSCEEDRDVSGAEHASDSGDRNCTPDPTDPVSYNEYLAAIKPVRFFLESCWTSTPPSGQQDLITSVGDVFRRAGHWRLAPWQMPAEYYHSRLRAKPLWSISELPPPLQREIRFVEKNVKLLRSVGSRLLEAGRFRNAELHLTAGAPGSFKELPAFVAGSSDCVSKKLCQLLDRAPLIKNYLHGTPKFSLVSGGALVPPHFSSTNLRLRVHIPLDVPSEPAPWLAIRNATGALENYTAFWSETQVFDDSFEHQVGYSGTGSRLIFICDLPHPDLLSGSVGQLEGQNSATVENGISLLVPVFREGFDMRLRLEL